MMSMMNQLRALAPLNISQDVRNRLALHLEKCHKQVFYVQRLKDSFNSIYPDSF
jgi:hypothetical protein